MRESRMTGMRGWQARRREDGIKRSGWGGGGRARGSEKRLPLHASRRVPRKGGQIREDGKDGRGSTRGWHLNGDVLYVEPRRQNDSGSKAASASKTKRQKSLKGKSIRRIDHPLPTCNFVK